MTIFATLLTGRKWLFLSILLTVSWMLLMGWLVKPLTSKDIVQFELARTPESAVRILAEWDQRQMVLLFRRSVYLDFVFLILYCFSISLACRVFTQTGDNPLRKAGMALSKVIWIAGISDAVENVAMLATTRKVTQDAVSVAYYSALIKFTIVLLALLFLVIALILVLGKKGLIRRPESVD